LDWTIFVEDQSYGIAVIQGQQIRYLIELQLCPNVKRGEERARSKLGVPNGNETENMYLNFVLSVEVGLKSQLSMIRFWSFRSTKLVAEMKVPSPIMRFSMIGNNWLLALGVGSG
uniref:Uncharacterized protein n=1 Tax=Wuchereria bancrofti TaxID=6293 RepID=A0AAF5Q6L0_WUCBA